MLNDLTVPDGGFHTITADPPWPYGNRVRGESVQTAMVKDGSRRQVSVSDWTYDPMPMDEIAGLSVREVSARDAHLYLWTTNSFMDEAYDVARAWGFTPKTILTWGKVRQDGSMEPSMKSGYYFRGATEHVVFATRGSLPKPTEAIPTLFLHPRIPQHSAKPERFYRKVVEVVSPGPYLEMFARVSRPGWSSWGNQVDQPLAPPEPEPDDFASMFEH